MSIWQKPPLGSQPIIRVPGLVADWVMNDGGGPLSKIQDYSGNGNHGTLVADTHFVGGRVGPALSFDGTEDEVTLTQGQTPSAKELSLSSWVFLNSLASSQFVYAETINGSTGNRFSLSVTTSGQARMAGRDDDLDAFTVFALGNSSRITTGVWYHIVCVFDANTGNHKVYVNGIDDTVSISSGEDGFDSTEPLHVAIGTNAVVNFTNGLIDSLKIHNRALNPGEVQQLHLDSFWHFRHDPIELWTAATPAIPPPTGIIGKTSTKISLSEFLGAARFAPTIHNEAGATGTTPALVPAFVTGGLLSKETTRLSTPANCFLGVADERWDLADIWFERAIVRPPSIAFGNILSTQSATISVYSSHRNQPITLTQIINNLGAGSSILNVPTVPFIMQPQSGFQVTLEVTLAGVATINDTIEWVFSVGSEFVNVTGERIIMFPLPPEAPLTEILEFLTDIMTSVDGSEHRVAIRKNPRQFFQFELPVDSDDRQFLSNLLYDWQSRVFGLPIWPDLISLTVAGSVSDLTITVDNTDFSDFRVGSLAVVFTDRFEFDVLEVVSFNSTSITFLSGLTFNYLIGTAVMPLRTAQISASIRGSRAPIEDESLQVRFQVLENDVGSTFASTAAFNSLNSKVLLDGPNAMSRRMSESILQRQIILEALGGSFSALSPWATGKRTSVKGFVSSSRSELYDIRRLLHALRGRQVSFYLPTFTNDLTPTVKLSNGAATMAINNVGFTRFARERGPSRNILRVIETDGTVHTRDIISSSEVDSKNETLGVDSPWPNDIEIVDIERIEYVELVRFDTDKIRIEHANSKGDARIMIPVKTVFE